MDLRQIWKWVVAVLILSPSLTIAVLLAVYLKDFVFDMAGWGLLVGIGAVLAILLFAAIFLAMKIQEKSLTAPSLPKMGAFPVKKVLWGMVILTVIILLYWNWGAVKNTVSSGTTNTVNWVFAPKPVPERWVLGWKREFNSQNRQPHKTQLEVEARIIENTPNALIVDAFYATGTVRYAWNRKFKNGGWSEWISGDAGEWQLSKVNDGYYEGWYTDSEPGGGGILWLRKTQ